MGMDGTFMAVGLLTVFCVQYARLEMERQGMHVPSKIMMIDDPDYKL